MHNSFKKKQCLASNRMVQTHTRGPKHFTNNALHNEVLEGSELQGKPLAVPAYDH